MYRISKVETGKKIRKLMAWYGVTVREVQEEMGLESPQAVYKWINGRAIPSTENLLILSHLLNVPMEEMLVVEQSPADWQRKKVWEEKHPPAFMAYRMRAEELVYEADAQRFYQYFDILVQERIRAAYSF